MKNIAIEWKPVGNLYDIYWDEENKIYDWRGPLLYCAYVQMTAGFQRLLQAEHLVKWRVYLQRKRKTGDEKRFIQFDKQLKEKKPENDTLFLLYIGQVGFGKKTSLGTRLFENYDPASSFCTYLLQASPAWIMIAVADCKKLVTDKKGLECLERCEISKHEPPLNIEIKEPDPNQTKQIRNNCAPGMQELLKRDVYP